jgi:RNA 2',3'-cyclic 3'-phosphodiesterase
MARNRAARPEAKALRLFIAVDIPLRVREELEVAALPLRDRFPRARWAPPANWHVTLKFLGRTWPRLVDWVGESIDLVARSERPFETKVEGMGAFPSERRMRVLWAGLDDEPGRLAGIAEGLAGALAREFDPERRAFTPHLTIARFDPPATMREGLPAVGSDPFPVDRLVLYRSHLRRPAPVYEPLDTFELRGRPSREGV